MKIKSIQMVKRGRILTALDWLSSSNYQNTNNFSKRLLSHMGADAKTGLAFSHRNSALQKSLNIICSFMGPVTESVYLLY
jgi:hypothetical protein